MKHARLQDWELQAIHDAYVAGEKVEAIASEFGIVRYHVKVVAKRLGAAVRTPGRPLKRKTVSNPKTGSRVSSRPLMRTSLAAGA